MRKKEMMKVTGLTEVDYDQLCRTKFFGNRGSGNKHEYSDKEVLQMKIFVYLKTMGFKTSKALEVVSL